MVKGEGKATSKVAGRVKVKPNELPDYLVITGNSINYLLWPQCLNRVRRQFARNPPSGLSPPRSHGVMHKSDKCITSMTHSQVQG